jgi:DcmR-like sensory protein
VTSADDSSTSEQVATIGGLTVRTHDHLCVLYRGEDQRDALMAEFLAEGVRAGDRCYCLITPDKHQRIAAAVSEDGGRVDFIEPDLQLAGPKDLRHEEVVRTVVTLLADLRGGILRVVLMQPGPGVRRVGSRCVLSPAAGTAGNLLVPSSRKGRHDSC